MTLKKEKVKRRILPPAVAELSNKPASYIRILSEIKARVAEVQSRATLAVNRELLALYWSIGRIIIDRQENEKWGTSVIEKLAADLQKAFPGVEGFSPRNIWRMRAFYLEYSSNGVSN